MKLIMDFRHYQPWSGARNTYALIECHNKLDELDELITKHFPDGLTAIELNDILWFGSKWVLDNLGIEVDNDELE